MNNIGDTLDAMNHQWSLRLKRQHTPAVISERSTTLAFMSKVVKLMRKRKGKQSELKIQSEPSSNAPNLSTNADSNFVLSNGSFETAYPSVKSKRNHFPRWSKLCDLKQSMFFLPQ